MTGPVLITGSRGFIGRALTQRLLESGHPLHELPQGADIGEPVSLEGFRDKEISQVFHLAARTFVPDSWRDPGGFYRTNVIGTQNVLEFCRQKSASLLYVSSYVYGKPERLPIPEEAPLRPNNPYAHSKCLAEQLCRFYAQEFGVRVTVLRPFNIYGPGQRESFLIPSVIRQTLESDGVSVKSLTPRRDYLYLDDFLDVLLLSTGTRQSRYEVYNIGAGISYSVRDVIDEALAVAGRNIPVISEEEDRKNEIDDVVADIGKARRELGWQPQRSFREGIRRMIKYERERIYGA
ncbi:MAG: NAD(P)-dependent oxidoreductase [Nitrospirales bacterium]|nr:NAD(P)-dependent oxidoreductase [Nitrospirales bacterium]